LCKFREFWKGEDTCTVFHLPDFSKLTSVLKISQKSITLSSASVNQHCKK